MKPPLTQVELRKMRCMDPTCTTPHEGELYLHSECHTGEGIDAAYKDGVLHFFCHVCEQPIVRIAVKEQQNEGPLPRH